MSVGDEEAGVKLLIGNGRVLDVRDVGDTIMQIKARTGGPPIKVNGRLVMSDDDARALLKELLSSGWYDRTVFDPSTSEG